MISYAQAVLQDRHTACGVILRPLTLGHALVLHRVGSPWICDGTSRKRESLDSVIECAFIASRPWHVAANSLNSRWGAFIMRWMAASRRSSLPADFVRLTGWWQSQWESPLIKRIGKDDARNAGADYLAILSVAAQSELGVPRAEVFDAQIKRLIYELLVVAEQKGNIAILEKPEPTWEEIMQEGKKIEEQFPLKEPKWA